MPKGKPWTVEEERKLRDLVAAGRTAREIAVELNRYPNAVYEKGKRLGLVVIITMRAPRKIITSDVQLPGALLSVEEGASIVLTLFTRSSVIWD